MRRVDDERDAEPLTDDYALSVLSQVVTSRQKAVVIRPRRRRPPNPNFWVIVYCVSIGLFTLGLIALEASGLLQQWFAPASPVQISTPSVAMQKAEDAFSEAELLLNADRPTDALILLRNLQYETQGDRELASAIDQSRLSRDLEACEGSSNNSAIPDLKPSASDSQSSSPDFDENGVPKMFPRADWQHPTGDENGTPTQSPQQKHRPTIVETEIPTSSPPPRAVPVAIPKPSAAPSLHDHASATAMAAWVAMIKKDANGATRLFQQAERIERNNEWVIVGKAALPQLYGEQDIAISNLETLVASGHAYAASINLARLYLHSSPVRAAKLLNDCLDAHYGNREELLNDLGLALWIANQQGMHSPTIDLLEASYKSYDQQLAQSRPGQQRWGSQWLPESAAKSKWNTFRQRHDDLTTSQTHVEHLQADLAKLQQEYSDAKGRTDFDLNGGKQHRENIQAFEQAINDCQHHLSDAQHQLGNASSTWDKTEKPPFSGEIPLYVP